MEKFCSKCGSEIQGNFCSNCGKKVGEVSSYNSVVDDYLKQKIDNKNNHNTYRLVTGIIMIIIGSCLVLASMNEESARNLIGYNVFLGFTLPGIFSLAGGILSILSRKRNILLLVTGILYLCGALVNMCGIHDVSILFILSVVFGILNIVFYYKNR